MRGPKPHPVEQRRREGNPSKQKMPEPLLIGGRPTKDELAEPPAHIPPEAKDFWHESVARLIEVGIVDRVDLPTLELLAVAFARIRQCQRVLATTGLFILRNGVIREHPALKMEREETSLFLKMAEHYALTPVARTRLGLAELHRRSLATELNEGLRPKDLKLVEDDEVVDEIDQAVDAVVSG